MSDIIYNKFQSSLITFINLFFKKDNDFYLANTGGITNGDGKAVKKLSEQEVNDLV